MNFFWYTPQLHNRKKRPEPESYRSNTDSNLSREEPSSNCKMQQTQPKHSSAQSNLNSDTYTYKPEVEFPPHRKRNEYPLQRPKGEYCLKKSFIPRVIENTQTHYVVNCEASKSLSKWCMYI
jgi:hypothetical protein